MRYSNTMELLISALISQAICFIRLKIHSVANKIKTKAASLNGSQFLFNYLVLIKFFIINLNVLR